MEFVCLFFSFVCGLNMYVLIKKFNLKDVLIITAISMMYMVALIRFIPFQDNVKDISEYKLGVITGKEGEYVKGMDYMAYLPEKAYNNRFYIATRSDSIEVLEGEVEVTDVQKVGTSLDATVTAKGDVNKLELPYIYYPGYEVRYDGMLVDNYETENGFIGIELKKDEGRLEVEYKATKEMIMGIVLSIIGIAVVLI